MFPEKVRLSNRKLQRETERVVMIQEKGNEVGHKKILQLRTEMARQTKNFESSH